MNSIEIKKIRKSMGLTQEKFAETLEVSKNSVQCWETDKRRPSFSMVKHIQETYNKHTKNVSIFEKIIDSEGLNKYSEIIESVIKNHDNLLLVERYANWFEVMAQRRAIQILKE